MTTPEIAYILLGPMKEAFLVHLYSPNSITVVHLSIFTGTSKYYD